jgi:ferritin-like metal-binding protein YciE
MTMITLQDLFALEIKDVYDAEHRLTKALPRLASGASDLTLKSLFAHHLNQTELHIIRLEVVFKTLDIKPARGNCEAIKNLIEEANGILRTGGVQAITDAALIAVAQQIEHHEIASYGSLRVFAEVLGYEPMAYLLHKTLSEERLTDEKLTRALQMQMAYA